MNLRFTLFTLANILLEIFKILKFVILRVQMKKQFKNFEDAKKFARTLNLKSFTDWKNFKNSKKFPHNIPKYPNESYKNNGWKGWGDFLGTGNVQPSDMNYNSIKKSKKYVQTLNIKSQTQWRKYVKNKKLPVKIPNRPDTVYRDKGWKGWGDFLGTGNLGPKTKFWSYEISRNFVHKLKLKSRKEWSDYLLNNLIPKGLSRSPGSTYKNKGWLGWGDWLGSFSIQNQQKIFWSFTKSREYSRKLNLESSNLWRKIVKSKEFPREIPRNPSLFYKKEWVSWGDWLGTENYRRAELKSFDNAKMIIQSLDIKGRKSWRNFIKSGQKPVDIPSSPDKAYKNEWKGWGDWFGTGAISPVNRSKQWRSFNDSKKFVRKLNIKTLNEWREFCNSGKLPLDIPKYPWEVYGKMKNKIK